MKTQIYIYLDDLRQPPQGKNVLLARTYKDAIGLVQWLDKDKTELYLDLDHDLGTKKTGYDFCKYLVENGWKGYFHCHSANPVGVGNMRQLLTHYDWIEY